jgi:SAM-dependent methyltransferase
MAAPTLQAQVEAAHAYESLFVPALFGPWAATVADAAGIQPGDRVLDVACGTGVLAREAAARTGPAGHVAGVDPNAGMLEVARRLAPAVEWQHGFAESLPLPDASFDAVISQFGLMFFADRRQAIREMLRVLAPGGRVGIAVWDALDNSPAYAAEVALVERLAGAEAAAALRAPFVLGDRIRLASLFIEAGVGSVQVTTHHGTGRFPSIRVMVEADLRGWLPVMGVMLDEERIADILEAAEQDLQPFVTADGSVAFDCPAHVVTGTRA